MDQDAIMALTEQLVATIFSRVGFQPYSILSIPSSLPHRMRNACKHGHIHASFPPCSCGLHAASHMPVPSCSP